jgi:hypothetical protein
MIAGRIFGMITLMSAAIIVSSCKTRKGECLSEIEKLPICIVLGQDA